MAVLFAGWRRHRNNGLQMTSKEDVRDNVRDNVIHYDDEGGGEEDTHAFDMGTLRNTHSTCKNDRINRYGHGVLPHLSGRHANVRSPDVHRQTADVSGHPKDAEMIWASVGQRLEDAARRRMPLPYDPLAAFAYEGDGSASLSSVEESWLLDELGDLSSLGDWGRPLNALDWDVRPAAEKEDSGRGRWTCEDT